MAQEHAAVNVSGPPTETWTVPPAGELDPAVVEETFRRMILHPEYPCVGARSVLTQARATVQILPRLGSPEAAELLLPALDRFASTVDFEEGFASFLAVFPEPARLTEERFEQLLWQQLQLLAEADEEPWTDEVSDDPADPHFSFSVAGTPFFIVGLHPDASRLARRAPWPTLVFNAHQQFEQLRASGHYGRMQDRIRDRDVRLQGCVNPMVEDFGESSEARQYSGRAVDETWTPPVDLNAAQIPHPTKENR